MRSFFENKAAYAVTVTLFTVALAWNTVHGGITAIPGHLLLPERWDVQVVAHGPSLPPDPWEGVWTPADWRRRRPETIRCGSATARSRSRCRAATKDACVPPESGVSTT